MTRAAAIEQGGEKTRFLSNVPDILPGNFETPANPVVATMRALKWRPRSKKTVLEALASCRITSRVAAPYAAHAMGEQSTFRVSRRRGRLAGE